jgi:hypothetical protein
VAEYWWAFVLGGVLLAGVLGGVFLIFWLDRHGRWRQEQLRLRGMQVDATVEHSAMDDGLWEVHYRFLDASGREHLGLDYLQPGRHEQPAEGGKVRVVYLPDAPWVSGLAALWLR